MKKEHNYYVYIMANRRNGTLYTGMSNNIYRRVLEHKNKLISGFSSKYNTTLLVYYEYYTYINSAIAREKDIKRWKREHKLKAIEKMNPNWLDLYDFLLNPNDQRFNEIQLVRTI